MLNKTLCYSIIILILNNFNTLNASIINENSLKDELHNELTINNMQNNTQYWNEFAQTIKCDAKETLKERFNHCTNWITTLLKSNNFFYKICSFNNYKYIIDSIDEIIDIGSFENEIKMRKNLLNDINNKEDLNGNAWSEIPLRIFGYNEEYSRYIGQYLFCNCKLLPNHWDMKFEKNYNNVKLNFYASYEYQTPKFYQDSINSEKALSICLSAIEMDLITSNHITSNIELFANHIITRKNDVAKAAIARYRKYFNDTQNELLARHIISYYLQFPGEKKMNIARYLTVYYVLNDIFKSLKPNKFLECIKNYKSEDWFDIIIQKYLDNEFGTNYNKSYLNSFKEIILKDKQYFNQKLMPAFQKYTTSIFRKLVETNKRKLENNYDLLKISNLNKDKEYNYNIKTLRALNTAMPGYQVGSKTINNIITYLDFNKKPTLNKKNKK